MLQSRWCGHTILAGPDHAYTRPHHTWVHVLPLPRHVPLALYLSPLKTLSLERTVITQFAVLRSSCARRCHRCHGTGSLPCELCTGSGLRYPHLSADHYRQCAGQPGAAGGEEGDCPVE